MATTSQASDVSSPRRPGIAYGYAMPRRVWLIVRDLATGEELLTVPPRSTAGHREPWSRRSPGSKPNAGRSAPGEDRLLDVIDPLSRPAEQRDLTKLEEDRSRRSVDQVTAEGHLE